MAVINGKFLPNVLNGTADDDTINGFGSSDVLSGLDGNDILDGGDGDDVLNGGNGNDTLIGGTNTAGPNTHFNGDAGNDLMIATVGGLGEVFDGGDDIDTVSFAVRNSGVTVALSAPLLWRWIPSATPRMSSAAPSTTTSPVTAATMN